jgi:hypothetical protein
VNVQKHMEGRWRTPRTDDNWEHYGYKSWQVVVQWKKDLIEPLKSEKLYNDLESLREKMPNGFKSLRVEFQVGTVVMQAWAEVQHNIIYKNPHNIHSTPTMKRMIDAINGLAITADIMLKELDRSLEDARKEAEELAERMRVEQAQRIERLKDKLKQLKSEQFKLEQEAIVQLEQEQLELIDDKREQFWKVREYVKRLEEELNWLIEDQREREQLEREQLERKQLKWKVRER